MTELHNIQSPSNLIYTFSLRYSYVILVKSMIIWNLLYGISAILLIGLFAILVVVFAQIESLDDVFVDPGRCANGETDSQGYDKACDVYESECFGAEFLLIIGVW